MSAFDYASPSGVWGPEMVPGATHYWRWDVSQSKMLNGDDGGIYAPTKQIIIGGAGLLLETSTISGGVRTERGGRLWLRWKDIPRLNPRTIKRMVSLLTAQPDAIEPLLLTGNSRSGVPGVSIPADLAMFTVAPGPTPCGLQPDFCSGLTVTIPREHIIAGQDNFDGSFNAQLSRVVLTYRVLQRPTAVPPLSLSLAVTTTEPNIGQALPPQGLLALLGRMQRWSPGMAAPQGTYVTPQRNITEPLSYFRCITPTNFTSFAGVVEPNWNTTPGAVTFDALIAWQCIGAAGQDTPTSVDDYYNGGAAKTLSFDFDPIVREYVRTDRGSLAVQILNLPTDGWVLLHSLELTFNNITAWTWF